MADADQDLTDLNEDLKAAGLPPLGAVSGEEEGEGNEEESQGGTEIVPPLEDEESEEESDESESEDEEESDEDESEDEDEEEDDDSGEGAEGREAGAPAKKPITIPYRQHRDETQALKEQVSFWKEAAEKAQGSSAAAKPVEEQGPSPIQVAGEKLAKELGLDPAKSKLLVETIVDAARSQTLPKELMDRLDRFEKSEERSTKERAVQAEAAYFEAEWNGFAPTIKEAYPNATPEQLQQAREAMDIIAHSTRFAKIHSVDKDGRPTPEALAFIFSRTKTDFDAFMRTPKKRTFEQGRSAPSDQGGRKFTPPPIGAETPESIAKLESEMFGDDDDDGLTFYDEEGKKIRR